MRAGVLSLNLRQTSRERFASASAQNLEYVEPVGECERDGGGLSQR